MLTSTQYVNEVVTKPLTISNGSGVTLAFNIATSVPQNGLVAYYPFTGNGNDESRSGNDGIFYGATFTEDRFRNPNSAYSFDGEDDYVETSGNIDAAPNSFSISLWFNHSIEEYCGNLFGGVDDYRVFVAICGDNKLHYWLGEGEGMWNIIDGEEGSTMIQSNVWYHLVFTGDDSDVKAYVNGVEDFSASNSGSDPFSTPLDIVTFFPSLLYISLKGPFFFYDVVREFSSTPYRDILVAWGKIREKVVFDRDEEGHYICQTVEENP